MIQDFNDFWKIILSTAIILLIFLFLFRKHIVHVLDPLFFYIISQAFSIELGFLVIDKPTYLFNLLICQVCFLAGFFLCAGKAPSKAELSGSVLFKNKSSFDISLIKWYGIGTALILLLANAVQMKNSGIALFSNNPSEAKVTNFTAGNGIVRRMDWGVLYVAGLFLLVMILLRKKLKYIFLFFIILAILALGGSKGALVYFVLSISLLSCFSDVKSFTMFKKIRFASFILLGVAVILAGVIIYYSNSASSFNEILFSFVSRFLFFGDSMIYYYNDSTVQYFSHYNIINYLQDDFNSVFGLLRIIPYNEQLGYRLINYYLNINSDTFGPSIPYYVKGNIYFGYYGSFIYSLVIGAIIGFVRSKFYALIRNNKYSVFIALIIIHINLIIYTLAQDSPVFITVLFDTLLFSLPAGVIIFVLHVKSKPKVILY